MAIKNLVSKGLGFGGSTTFLITKGLGVGSAPAGFGPKSLVVKGLGYDLLIGSLVTKGLFAGAEVVVPPVIAPSLQGLQHSPADIISRILIELGLGVDPEDRDSIWPIHVGDEPNLPDNCITVYDTTGQDDGRSMIDGELWSHNGFQVRIRSTTQRVGWVKANAIQTTMARDVYQFTVTIDDIAYFVHCISRIGDILPLGKEKPQSTRKLFTVNAMAPIKQLNE